jgi:hypothetical protein
MVLPSPELLTQIERYILNRPNKSKTPQGLYKIAPTKKKPARYVYIPQQVMHTNLLTKMELMNDF